MDHVIFPINVKDDGPQVDLDDPLQIMSLLEKMTKISTPEKVQIFIREIIVSSN